MADVARTNENPRNPPKPIFCRPAGKPLQIAQNLFRAFRFSSWDLFSPEVLRDRIYSPPKKPSHEQPVAAANQREVDGYDNACTETYHPLHFVQWLPLFDICRESSTNQPFFAKQSQFQKRTNEPKKLYNNDLRENRHLVQWEKQTQFKPNCRALPVIMSVNHIYPCRFLLSPTPYKTKKIYACPDLFFRI